MNSNAMKMLRTEKAAAKNAADCSPYFFMMRPPMNGPMTIPMAYDTPSLPRASARPTSQSVTNRSHIMAI